MILYDISYMWNLKTGTNECTYKTGSDKHRRQIYEYQRRKGGII